MTALTAMTDPLPRWALMWLLAGGVFLAGKVAMRAALGRMTPRPTVGDEAAWLVLWPGMDAAAFFRRKAALATVNPVGAGLLGTVTGAVLLWGIARHMAHPLAAGWVGMAGLVMVLHFGLFRLLATYWQHRGRPVRPIMDQPVLAVTLAEFWGQRWNRAFRDLAHTFIFRPAVRRWGRHVAMALVFLASGAVHELVITVPAGAGYGLPTAYFLVQALGMTLERRLLHGTPLFRRLFTHAFTLGPAFILFPPPFVERVMTPFFQFIHALP